MKHIILGRVASLLIAAALLPTTLTAEPLPAVTEVQVCYLTSATRSEDGTGIRKVYDLSPEQDPAGIPRSDFKQDGFRYTLIDLLQQELPEYESRPYTETVSLESKSKDMESVLALLLQGKEFATEDGSSGTPSLQLDIVQVEAVGYGSSAQEVSVTCSYPSLVSQDIASVPKSIEEDGRNLTLQNVNQRADSTASVAGYNLGDCYTVVAAYTDTATSSYVIGYTVTVDYTGTISRIALNRAHYVVILERGPLEPVVSMEESEDGLAQFNWAAILLPSDVVFAMGGIIGACLFVKWCRENKEDSE